MRILSQKNLNLNYDIPYEQVCLNINKKSENSFRIYAWHSLSCPDHNCYLVAEYTAEEKAKKMIGMLHEQYMSLCSLTAFIHGGAELFARSVSLEEAEEFSIYYKNMNVFQFPDDCEADVSQ